VIITLIIFNLSFFRLPSSNLSQNPVSPLFLSKLLNFGRNLVFGGSKSRFRLVRIKSSFNIWNEISVSKNLELKFDGIGLNWISTWRSRDEACKGWGQVEFDGEEERESSGVCGGEDGGRMRHIRRKMGERWGEKTDVRRERVSVYSAAINVPRTRTPW